MPAIREHCSPAIREKRCIDESLVQGWESYQNFLYKEFESGEAQKHIEKQEST